MLFVEHDLFVVEFVKAICMKMGKAERHRLLVDDFELPGILFDRVAKQFNKGMRASGLYVADPLSTNTSSNEADR